MSGSILTQQPQLPARTRFQPAERLDVIDGDAFQTLGRDAAEIMLANIISQLLADSPTTASSFTNLAISGWKLAISSTTITVTRGVLIGADGLYMVNPTDGTTFNAGPLAPTSGGNVYGLYAYYQETPINTQARRFWTGTTEVAKNTAVQWQQGTVLSTAGLAPAATQPATTIVTDQNGVTRIATLVGTFQWNGMMLTNLTSVVNSLFPMGAGTTTATGSPVNAWGASSAGNQPAIESTTSTISAPDIRSFEGLIAAVTNTLAAIKGLLPASITDPRVSTVNAGALAPWLISPISLSRIRSNQPLGVITGGVVSSVGGALQVNCAAATVADCETATTGAYRCSNVAANATLAVTANAINYVYVQTNNPNSAYAVTTLASVAFSASAIPIAIVNVPNGATNTTSAMIYDCRYFVAAPQWDGAMTVGNTLTDTYGSSRGPAVGGSNFMSIQAAIYYVCMADRASVAVPRVIRITEPLTLNAKTILQDPTSATGNTGFSGVRNLTIEGAGGGGTANPTHITTTVVNDDTFDLNGCTDCTFRDIRIVHNSSTSTTQDFAIFAHALVASTVSKLTLRNIHVNNAGSQKLRGFFRTGGTTFLVTNSVIEGCYSESSDFGILTATSQSAGGNNSGNRIFGNEFVQLGSVQGVTYADGICILWSGAAVTLNGNVITGSWPTGIFLAGTSTTYVTISGNSINALTIGINVSVGAAAFTSISGNAVVMSGATSTGIVENSASTDGSIVGNTISTVASGTSGIGIQTGGDRWTVSGNTISMDSSTATGINLQSNRCVATGNSIFNAVSYTSGNGIVVGTFNNNVVVGNGTGGTNSGSPNITNSGTNTVLANNT